jgi:hypothetical protein
MEPDMTGHVDADGPATHSHRGRGLLFLALLALLVAVALTIIDYGIKQDLVREAARFRDDMKGSPDERREPIDTPDAAAAPFPSRGHLAAMGDDPGTPADGVANGNLPRGGGGMLAREPGDRSLGDES